MYCEMCGKKTKVLNTRMDLDCVVRKRQCLACKHIFYTQEIDMNYDEGKHLASKLTNAKNVKI